MNELPATTPIELRVNGERVTVAVEHRDTLLDVLREQLELTGAKRACDRGECGACTVLIDGAPMVACNLLALQARGREIDTVEGLAARDDFAAVLDAFLAEDGGQCGFCVPGFAVATYAALQQHAPWQDVELRWELVGHVCRCNAYDRIAAAAREASVRWAARRSGGL